MQIAGAYSKRKPMIVSWAVLLPLWWLCGMLMQPNGMRLAMACAVLVAVWAFFRWQKEKLDESTRSLGIVLWSVALGFTVFGAYRALGMARWPMAHPETVGEYAYLLYCHFVLAITVLLPLAWAVRTFGVPHLVRWGEWNTKWAVLAAILVILASWTVLMVGKRAFWPSPLAVFILIAVMKALLTGLTEEICYRGAIQPAAIARFGVVPGIVFQALLYMSFHWYIGEAIVSRFLFLPAVFGLGIVLGVVTRWTRGIGWAVTAHTLLDIVVEWGNL